MQKFGSWTELVSIIFRKDTKAIDVKANTSITYSTDRTMELPENNADVTDVMVSRKSLDNGSKRLENKELSDDTITIVDPADTTKKIRFDAGTITTGNTRVITMLDENLTPVGETNTQTLTSKTLTSPAINTPNLDGGTASASSRVIVSKDTNANVTGLARKQAAVYYDTTNNKILVDNGATLDTLAVTATATPTSEGTVTSYFPTIQSAVKSIDVDDTPFTISTTDGFSTILADCNTGAGSPADITINLPAVADNTGRTLYIKKTDSSTNSVIIDTPGVEKIDGKDSETIFYQHGYISIISDGTNWQLLDAWESATVTAANQTYATTLPASVTTKRDGVFTRRGHSCEMVTLMTLGVDATAATGLVCFETDTSLVPEPTNNFAAAGEANAMAIPRDKDFTTWNGQATAGTKDVELAIVDERTQGDRVVLVVWRWRLNN